MQNYPGLFIVLEGSDGSGKTTQFNLLKERVEAVGYDVVVFNFPRYQEPSSHFVRSYLNGRYGSASSINPYTAALFYALDRFEAAPQIREALEQGRIVLCDRYVGSNMAHQGAKFASAAEQRGFFVWADSMEYQLLGIPRPSMNFFLRVPPETAFRLIAKKPSRAYTERLRDEHEDDINHLRASAAAYDLLCQLFPKDFKAIECSQNGRLLSIPAISDLIWQELRPMLPQKPPRPPRGKTIRLNNKITEQTPNHREARGTASRPAPTNQQIALEGVSFLAMRQLLQAPELRIRLGKTKSKNIYRPTEFRGKVAKQYLSEIERIAAWQSQISKRLQTYLGGKKIKIGDSRVQDADRTLRSLTPLAAQTDLLLSGTEQSLSALAAQLRTSNLAEVRGLSDRLEKINRPVEAEKPTLDDSTDFLSSALAELPQNQPVLDRAVAMNGSWPRNELDLLVELLYGHSNLSKKQLEEELSGWDYQKKMNALVNFLKASRENLTHCFKLVRYEWDLLTSGRLLLRFLAQDGWSEVSIQIATPRYGFEMPQIIEDSGLDDLYQRCFDASLSLFNDIQAAGFHEEAQYSVLLGHKLRWGATIDGESLRSILSLGGTSSALPEDYFVTTERMKELTAETHPILQNSMATLSESGSDDNPGRTIPTGTPGPTTKPKVSKKRLGKNGQPARPNRRRKSPK